MAGPGGMCLVWKIVKLTTYSVKSEWEKSNLI